MQFEKEAKNRERSDAAKVMRRFAQKVSAIQFARKGQSNWFAREVDLAAHFVHIHKFSFGSCFRVHCGVRILNESRDFVVLNGPDATQGFQFDDSENSLEICAENMFGFVCSIDEDWFANQRLDSLLGAKSCLDKHARQALARAAKGQSDADNVKLSKKLLAL